MRYLVAVIGIQGDARTYNALAHELMRRGHDVILYGAPTFQRHFEGSKAPYVVIDADATADPGVAQVQSDAANRYGFASLLAANLSFAPAYAKRMLADVKAGETIVVGSALGFVHRFVAESAGLPSVTLHHTPVSLCSVRHPARLQPGRQHEQPKAEEAPHAWLDPLRRWWTERSVYDACLEEPFAAARKAIGLAPIQGKMMDWIINGPNPVALFPRWFAEPASDWPVGVVQCDFPSLASPVEPEHTKEVEDFLEAGSAPIVFATGPADVSSLDYFMQSVIAVSRFGLRAITVVPSTASLPRGLPDSVLPVTELNLGKVLPQAAIMVHQGSIAMTAQALGAGVPQLIYPLLYDHFDTSAHIVGLGAGREISAEDYRSAPVSDALFVVLQDKSLRKTARELKGQLDAQEALKRLGAVLEKAGQYPGKVGK